MTDHCVDGMGVHKGSTEFWGHIRPKACEHKVENEPGKYRRNSFGGHHIENV